MRRSSIWLFALIAVGCSNPAKPVFIELSQISVAAPIQASLSAPKLKRAAPIQAAASVGAVAEKEIELLREEDKNTLRRTIDKETNQAIEEITDQLVTFYSKRIDDMSRDELAKLRPLRDELTVKYLSALRVIFERYAAERGPALTRLTFLTEFPPPETLIPLEGDDLTAKQKARRAEARELQRKIKALDIAYEAEIAKLEELDQQRITQETDDIQKRINAEIDRINEQARSEASNQVKRFSGALAGRIFGRYRFTLPASAAHQLNLKSVPIVQSATKPTKPSDPNRAKLMTEASIFMELRGYSWGSKEQGAADVTEEFKKWRQKLNSGR